MRDSVGQPPRVVGRRAGVSGEQVGEPGAGLVPISSSGKDKNTGPACGCTATAIWRLKAAGTSWEVISP